MRFFLVAVAMFFVLSLNGCTIMQPAGAPWGLAENCEDVRCVVEAVEQAEPQTGNRFKFMEGYKDSPLLWMYDNGDLTVEYINPLLPVLLQVLGYAEIFPGKYGEIWKCHVKYTPSPAHRILVHELSHCKGYDDRGPIRLYAGYTEGQKEIIEKEGVTHWTDTEFYRHERYMGEDSIERSWVTDKDSSSPAFFTRNKP